VSSDRITLEPLDDLKVTVLVDNSSDLLLPSDERVVRPPLLGGAETDFSIFEGPGPDVVQAEHGFSAFIEFERRGHGHTVLFDTGISPNGMVENMRRLDLDPMNVGTVVMSHGHLDHTGGLIGFAQAVGRRNLPMVLHPDFWLDRRLAPPGRVPIELPTVSRRAVEEAGFDVIETNEPSLLLDGALLVTGEVERTTVFETGFPIHEARRGGQWTNDALIHDDQAIVAHLRGRGLVVITGCGHAGIVNILEHARALTGIDEVHAVIGGFHLTGAVFEPIIGPTVEHLRDLGPALLVPGHCTGWRAQRALSEGLSDAYVHPSVGTSFRLSGAGPATG
jgi:7,8-dihydropterin-6-yl-methyl-4-(beta-D-ribofuranosyl)aminobenzene 5'-phosphate synthase